MVTEQCFLNCWRDNFNIFYTDEKCLQPLRALRLYQLLHTRIDGSLQGAFIWAFIQALSTLIRFQTKTELFCSVFKKDLSPHLLFSYRFRPSTLQRRICLKTLLYPQCAWSNELDACAFQYIGPRNWREIEATWQRLSAILDTHGRVVLMTSPFSESIVFTVNTTKQRFQKASFSNRSTLESVFEWLRFRRCRVDDSRIRSKTAPFSFENGLVWKGP